MSAPGKEVACRLKSRKSVRRGQMSYGRTRRRDNPIFTARLFTTLGDACGTNCSAIYVKRYLSLRASAVST
jgi:hypothetical protein